MDKGSKRPTLRSRELRANMTAPERKLWNCLRSRQVAGTRFNTQFPIGPDYIADFAARTPRLVIEVDGDSHGYSIAHDAARTAYLGSRGYRVIRFWNNDVMGNIEGVVAEIEHVLADMPSRPCRKDASSSPLPRAGGVGGGHVPPVEPISDIPSPGPFRKWTGNTTSPPATREGSGEGMSDTASEPR